MVPAPNRGADSGAETKAQASGAMTPKARFLAAAFRRPVDRVPVWIMRQAGRYLPEYRQVRAGAAFLEMVRNPALAAEVTCQPIRRFGMDAAVIFSDILVPVAAMGVRVEFLEGVGPKLSPRIQSRDDLKQLHAFDPDLETPFLAEAIRLTRKEIGADTPIIGFSGAPMTTASYMVEGGSSRDFAATKRFLFSDPAGFRELTELVVDSLIPYLGFQVEAGADVLQIFDSWGGALDAATYRAAFFEPMERLICSAKALGVPVILYVNGCAHLLELLADLGPTVLSIDWRVDPADARRRIGHRVALQGNLDPGVLLSNPSVVESKVLSTLEAFGPEPGHIFNLGSGITPEVPVENVSALVSAVRQGRKP